MFVADEEALDADCELYACDTCLVADTLAELDDDDDNAEAWRLFHRLFTRFTVDTHVAAVLLAKLVADRDTDAAFDLMERFTVLYDTLHPAPEKGD